MLECKNLKLIVSDIDGCLSVDKGIPFDYRGMSALREHQDRAKNGTELPLTLCSGRGQSYMEAIGQFLGITEPMICEAGSLLYDPIDDSVIANPEITDRHLAALKTIREDLAVHLKPGSIRFEIGKEICLSINPYPFPKDPDELDQTILDLLDKTLNFADGKLFNINRSSCSVDITPKGVDKASGIKMLSEKTGIQPEEMLGIGDSYNDVAFLKKVGISSCPANGVDPVKAMVDYVSTKKHIDGVLDIIGHYSI